MQKRIVKMGLACAGLALGLGVSAGAAERRQVIQCRPGGAPAVDYGFTLKNPARKNYWRPTAAQVAQLIEIKLPGSPMAVPTDALINEENELVIFATVGVRRGALFLPAKAIGKTMRLPASWIWLKSALDADSSEVRLLCESELTTAERLPAR